jgi:hypothetical protein
MRLPGDLLAGDRQVERPLESAEQLRVDSDLDLDDVAPLARVAGIDRGRGRRGLRLAIGGREPIDRELLLRLRAELLVHRGEVLVGPGLDEALGELLLRRARAVDQPDDECSDRDDSEGERPSPQSPLALAQRPRRLVRS